MRGRFWAKAQPGRAVTLLCVRCDRPFARYTAFMALTCLSRWCAVVLAVSFADSVWGQASGDDTNAATWYRRAFEQFNALSPEQRDTIMNHDWGQPPSPEVRALLADPS